MQGYIVAGTEDGALIVIGQGPWVEVDDEEPVVLEDETEFSFSFYQFTIWYLFCPASCHWK